MSDTFQLRRVGADDLDLLAEIDPRLGSDSAYRAHIGELLAADMSWAAVNGDAGLGFAIVTRHFFGFPFVDLLEVADSGRRRGIGLTLMARCEAVHTADRIFTSTNESNDPMRRLLAKAAWKVSGMIEDLDPGDPELIYVKFRA
ncbi:MAG TPA: GNAT family N-acetyltransferase [Caulobacteraceae bacterium]